MILLHIHRIASYEFIIAFYRDSLIYLNIENNVSNRTNLARDFTVAYSPLIKNNRAINLIIFPLRNSKMRLALAVGKCGTYN